MTIDEFAAVTVRVIQRDGVDGYLPTACYPATRRMVVLEGYPEPILWGVPPRGVDGFGTR